MPETEEPSDFISRIVKDPSKGPGNLTVIRCWPGQDNERLYLSPDLAAFVDVHKSAILHREPMPLTNLQRC